MDDTRTAPDGVRVIERMLIEGFAGGDTAVTQANYEGTNSLAAGEIRGSVYAKASYYILPEMEFYTDLSISRYKGLSYYQQPPSVGGIVINADNAFLPAGINTQMTTLGLRSFT